MLTEKIASDFLAILAEELIPAMGCTEPIALAFASARAKEVLGTFPERIVARCSGNMIKNVRCVAIPNSRGMTGVESACVLGAFGGDVTRGMEVLESVTEESLAATGRFLEEGRCRVEYLESEIPLHFIIEALAGGETVSVEVRYDHTNIVRIEKNGTVLFRKRTAEAEGGRRPVGVNAGAYQGICRHGGSGEGQISSGPADPL